MNVFVVEGNLVDELSCGDEGFSLENPYTARSVEVVEGYSGKYLLRYRDDIQGVTNSEEKAVNFLMGGGIS